MVSAALEGPAPQTAQAGETVRDTADGGKYENGLEPSFVINKCRELMPTWGSLSPSVFQVNGPLSGLTNILYCVSHGDTEVEPQSVLFRMYGEAVSQLYDIDAANEVYKTLARHGFAPKVHSDFPEGRLEEWIYGSPLLDNPNRGDYRSDVGKVLAQFHMCDSTPGFPQHLPRAPRLFVTGGRWAEHIRTNYVPGCPMDRACKKVNLDAMEVLAEFDKLKGRIATLRNDPVGKEIVFCHNDAHENNILQLHADNSLRLIDFEYSGYNFAAYDIANYFAESTLDYSVSEFPFFAVRDDWMASDEQKRKCVAAYLTERLGKEVRGNDTEVLDPVLFTIESMILAAHLFWTVWGIIREPPRGCNPDEFGCIQFAEQRYAAYKRVLRRLQEKKVFAI